MSKKFKHVPGSLNSLIVLESAVRHASFTKAGDELLLTQPTVSRHIAVLEERLGKELFHRIKNRIVPTKEGHRLANAVSLGIGHTESVWEELSRTEHEDTIVLACSFGFADQWLLPRFSSLQEAIEGKKISVVTSDWMGSLDMTQIDVAVVADLALSFDRPIIPLFPEIAFPVCSPDFLEQHPQILNNPHALLDVELIQFDVGSSGYLDWKIWFEKVGINMKERNYNHIYDSYPFLCRAAQEGKGVAIGWTYLVDKYIQEGSLVRIGAAVRNRDSAYYLQFKDGSYHSATLKKISDWFVKRVNEEQNLAISGGLNPIG
ncbi:LysR substrate-binding domain-containing protein [Curvivirga sp.]|uniref:LysR substrate-binding domain-containing protein n=1 Tax=Curvivirga sp. TaxID=2856848 RepID=UPI003B5A38F1